MKAFGYAALLFAVVVCLVSYQRSGNPWCAFIAGAVAAFGICVWQRDR